MANNDKENKIKKFTKEAIGKTLNQFNKEIGIADLVEINKNQDRILNGILSQVNDENTEKTEKSNIITLDNSTDGIVELKEIQGDTNVNVSKIEEDMPITHDIGDKEGNVFTLNEITKGAISIGEVQGNTMVNCNKDDEKELVLMKDLSTQGDNNITITEGVDGGLVDVALEGNTLVNVSKTKDSTAVTKAYTVENSGNHIALQGGVDGNYRPVITGNTLVSIAIRSENTYDYLTHEGSWIIFNADGNSTYRIDPVYPRNELIKADTTYTVIIDVSQNTLDSYLEFNWSGLDGVDNGTCIGFDINIDAGATGRYIYVGNSKSDIVNQRYIISPRLTPSNTAGLIKFRAIILEGDYTDKPIPDYFTGLQSSFEDNLVTQEMVDSGEEEESNLGKYRVDYKSTQEDGTVGSTKTLYLNSPLLEGDTIEEKDGGIYHVHRYGKVVLDGSEQYINIYRNSDDYSIISFAIKGEEYYADKIYAWSNVACISNKFKSTAFQNVYIGEDNESISVSNSSHGFVITILKSKLTTQDVEGFKQWLQQNPVIVVYKLASPQYELIEQSNLVIPSYANGHLDFNTAVPVEKVNFLPFSEELVYLYANTQYTVQFVSDKAITVDITLGDTSLLAQNIVKGLNRITITTPATLANNKLIISGVGANISEVVVTDTNREFGYFEGMKSVGECEELEVRSNNKNLINTIDSIQECFIKKGTQVTASYDNCSITNTPRIEYYSKDMRLISWWSVYLKNPEETRTYRTFVIDEDCYFIKFISNGTSDINNVMLCIGTSTDYIPHQSNTQRLTHEPLRAVGDAKDRYVLIDGKWYIERNCREVVFDGSESWKMCELSDEFPNIAVFFRYNSFTFGRPILCDNFRELYYDSGILDMVSTSKEGVFSNDNKEIKFSLLKSKLSTVDITGFKQWLSNNPTTVVYQLDTPTYEPIDYNPLEVYSDTTHISTNSVIPTNITVKNHGFNCLLKPNTTYTVSSNQGLNTVTTGADIGDSCLRFYDEDTSDKSIMKDVLILEGDWTTKADLIPSNFSGIESAFEQELVTDENDANYGKYKVTTKVVGKNLFKGYDDISEIKGGMLYNLSSGTISTPTRFKFRVYDGNMKQITELSSRTYGVYYNESRKYFITGSDSLKLNNNKLDMPNNAKYLQPIENDQRYIDIQLEQGTEATAYEPYKESNITFYIDEPLRCVENAKDKVYVKDDKVIVQRNCGSVTLDGSNGTYIFSIDRGELIEFMCRNLITSNRSKISLCDKFSNLDLPNVEKCVTTGEIIYIQILKSRLQTQDIAGFKQWLQQNPVTVVYQLAEPTYEEVEYSSNRLILNTFNNESFNNSTLFLDTNISPKLSFKPLYEELVYVKNSTKYYIQFNAVGSGEVVINLGGTELTTEISEGYNCIPITTPSESTNLMTISGQGITISEVIVSEVVCGGYYKGLQSCFEEHMENGKYRVLLRGIALDGSKVNGIKLYINEPLRGIEGIKDRLCIKNGKLMVERKCGEIIINETNPYNISAKNSIYPSVLRIFLHSSNIPNMKRSGGVNILCDTLQYYGAMNKDVIGIGYGDGFDIHLPLPTTSTLDEAREYLKNNPLKIIYQLAEPTYEEATNEYGLPIVFEGYENGIVYIDSAVTPTTHIKYTSNNQLATTLSEAEEQNISTQEDINMNVITYMMDIDMMLTDMEMSNDTSVMAVRRDSSNENMLDRMSDEDKKVYRDNTVVMLEKMITANVLDKEDIEGRIDMYYNKNRISKEQYKYLKSLL